MTVHITKRLEIYCEDNQASIYVEQDKEFGNLELIVSEVFAGGAEPTRVSISKEVAEGLITTLTEGLEDL